MLFSISTPAARDFIPSVAAPDTGTRRHARVNRSSAIIAAIPENAAVDHRLVRRVAIGVGGRNRVKYDSWTANIFESALGNRSRKYHYMIMIVLQKTPAKTRYYDAILLYVLSDTPPRAAAWVKVNGQTVIIGTIPAPKTGE